MMLYTRPSGMSEGHTIYNVYSLSCTATSVTTLGTTRMLRFLFHVRIVGCVYRMGIRVDDEVFYRDMLDSR